MKKGGIILALVAQARSGGTQETRDSRGRHLGETERERSFGHREADRRRENQTSCHESSAAERSDRGEQQAETHHTRGKVVLRIADEPK
jgi:hypothetical protein